MKTEEIYKFSIKNYNKKGINTKDGSFFLGSIREWQMDFHRRHPALFANYLVINLSTLLLFDVCMKVIADESKRKNKQTGKAPSHTKPKSKKPASDGQVFPTNADFDHRDEETLRLIIDDTVADDTVIFRYESAYSIIENMNDLIDSVGIN